MTVLPREDLCRRVDSWKHDAAKDAAIVGGGTIKAGGKTVESSFSFHNTAIRVGYGHDYKLSGDTTSTLGFQLGLGLYSVNYLLGQQNNIQETFREQRESWMEWTPTVGFAYKARSVTLRYNFSSSCVISRCLSFGDKVNIAQPDWASSALTFDGGTATSHKLWISVPIR